MIAVVLAGCGMTDGDETLSTSEQYVFGDYRSSVLALNPVGYWRLGEAPLSSVLTDSTAHGFDGFYGSGTAAPVLGVSGAVRRDPDTSAGFTGLAFGQVDDQSEFSLTRDWDYFEGPDNGTSTTWGTAPVGGAWTCNFSCGLPYYKRAGGVATIYPASTGATYEQGRAASLADGEMQIRVKWSEPAAGGPLVPAALMARRISLGNHVRAELVEDPNAFDKHSIRLVRQTNGIDTILDTQALGTFGDGIWWLIRFRFEGDQLKARAWPEQLDQPSTWHVEATTSPPVPGIAAGTIAVRSTNAGGTARPTVQFTNFWLQTLGFTVSMFVSIGTNQIANKSFPLGKSQFDDGFDHSEDEWLFRYHEDVNALKGYVFNRGGGKGAGVSVGNLTPNTWHHIVMMLEPGDWRDRYAGMRMWIDGRRGNDLSSGRNYLSVGGCVDPNQCNNYECQANYDANEDGVVNASDTSLCWRITPLNGTRPLGFGRVGTGGNFRGGVDEVAIFPRLLTYPEIVNLYNSACRPSPVEYTGLTASASSTQDFSRLFRPANAVDDNTSSRWSSQFTDNEWITVNLGAVKDISQIRLVWQAAYASQYDVLTSTDGVAFQYLKTVNKSNANPDTVEIYRSAQFVKVQGVTRATQWGYSLFELDVFGCDVGSL